MAIVFGSVSAQASHIVSAVNMMRCDLILINAETDEIVITPLTTLPGWPEAVCQHSWILPDETKVFISTDANKSVAPRLQRSRSRTSTGPTRKPASPWTP